MAYADIIAKKITADNFKRQIVVVAHMIIGNMQLLLSFNNFRQNEKFLVNAAVAEVVVTEEAVEAVVAVILDHTGAKRAVWIVATKLFTAPLQIFKNWVGKGLETKLNVIQPYPEYIQIQTLPWNILLNPMYQFITI